MSQYAQQAAYQVIFAVRSTLGRLNRIAGLRDVFCGKSSEMRMVRRGIMNYWRHSPKGRQASMALLSTADGRLITLIYQFVRVVVHGILAEARDPIETAKDRSHGADPLIRGLLSVLAHQLWQVLGKCRTILAWGGSGT